MITSTTIRKFVAENGNGKPEQIIKELAAKLLEKSGQFEPPVRLVSLLPYCPVSIVPRVHLAHLAHDAQMTKEGQDYQITVNKDHIRGRQRFSVAHEIGHSFFLPFREADRRRDAPAGPMAHEDGIEERLCNIFATEVLMPYSAFSRDLAKRPLSPESIANLAQAYDVSFHAAALRAGEVANKPLLTGMLHWDKLGDLPRFIWSMRSHATRAKGRFVKRVIRARTGLLTREGRSAIRLDLEFADGSLAANVVAVQSGNSSNYLVAKAL